MGLRYEDGVRRWGMRMGYRDRIWEWDMGMRYGDGVGRWGMRMGHGDEIEDEI